MPLPTTLRPQWPAFLASTPTPTTKSAMKEVRQALASLTGAVEQMISDHNHDERGQLNAEVLEARLMAAESENQQLRRSLQQLLNKRSSDREDVIARLKFKLLAARAALAAANEHITGDDERTMFDEDNFREQVQRCNGGHNLVDGLEEEP